MHGYFSFQELTKCLEPNEKSAACSVIGQEKLITLLLYGYSTQIGHFQTLPNSLEAIRLILGSRR